MKNKLSEIAQEFCKDNNITTDEQLKNLKKELKITMRLDYGLKLGQYNKMSLSELIEYQLGEVKKEKISGSNN